MTTIIVTHESNEMDEYDFDVEIKTITVGRRSTNDVCVPHLSVSGNHCKITINDNGSTIEDLSSTNGTYINGRLISRQVLHDGDDIVIGKARLTFLQPDAASFNDGETVGGNVADSNIIEHAENSADEQPLTLAEKAALHRKQSTSDTPDSESEFAGDYYEPDESEIAAMIEPAGDLVAKPSGTTSDTVANSENASEIADDEKPQGGLRSTLTGVPAAAAAASVAGVAAATTSTNKNDAMSSDHSSGVSMGDSEAVTHSLDSEPERDSSGAVIEIKNGAKSGQVLPIDKPVTTLGRPGIQIAAIMKKPEGYFLMHIESEDHSDRPKLNDNMIGDDPVMLSSGDSLNVAGIDVQFMLS